MGIALYDMEIVKKFDTEKLSSIAESINFALQAGFKVIKLFRVIKVFKAIKVAES